jgi:hypothetical protein
MLACTPLVQDNMETFTPYTNLYYTRSAYDALQNIDLFRFSPQSIINATASSFPFVAGGGAAVFMNNSLAQMEEEAHLGEIEKTLELYTRVYMNYPTERGFQLQHQFDDPTEFCKADFYHNRNQLKAINLCYSGYETRIRK